MIDIGEKAGSGAFNPNKTSEILFTDIANNQ